MSKWVIHEPRREKMGDTIRVSATVTEGDIQKELWYDIPSITEEYLFDNCLDAFLVVVLPIASRRGCDLEVHGRISKRLYHSIINNVLPLLSDLTIHTKIYHPIRISVDELLCPSPCGHTGHVGTGLSCGVDSFNAVLSLRQREGIDSLDYVTFFNVGSHYLSSDSTGDKSRALFDGRRMISTECAKEIGLPLFVIDSNIGQYAYGHDVKYAVAHTFLSLSAVLACGSFFNRYYYASGLALSEVVPHLCGNVTDHIEFYLTTWLSTEYTDFYSEGFTKTRREKIKEIAGFPIVQKYLNVCILEVENCGKCQKCIGTLRLLHALEKIEHFREVFDVDAFYRLLEDMKNNAQQKQ